jgi:hypothetical protein
VVLSHLVYEFPCRRISGHGALCASAPATGPRVAAEKSWPWVLLVNRLYYQRIREKAVDASIIVLGHRTTQRHHHGHGGIDLLVGTLLGRIQVTPPICLAHDIAEAPLQHRVAVMARPTKARRGVELDNRQATM